jgi:hypothetical protein
MTTFLELQDEVQFRIRQRADMTTFVKAKINESILDVMLLVEPPEFFSSQTVTTASGTASYNLQASNDVLAVVGVSNISTNITFEDRRLIRGDWREFDDMDQDFTASRNLGRPRKWFRYTNSIFLYDKVADNNAGSNWSIRVRTLLRPTALSADADVFALELEWKEPVVLRAAEKLQGILGDAEAAALTNQQFIQSVGSVVDRIQAIENREDRDARMSLVTHGYRPTTSGRSAR